MSTVSWRFFDSHKSMVWKEGFGILGKMVTTVNKLFDECDKDTGNRVWQSLLKTYNQVSWALRWNDFEFQHSGVEQRQQQGCLREV